MSRRRPCQPSDQTAVGWDIPAFPTVDVAYENGAAHSVCAKTHRHSIQHREQRSRYLGDGHTRQRLVRRGRRQQSPHQGSPDWYWSTLAPICALVVAEDSTQGQPEAKLIGAI